MEEAFTSLRELENFFNHGFGWVCRFCEREIAEKSEAEKSEEDIKGSRLLLEGEAEGGSPRLSTHALAKWADPAQRILMCPRCGITELADKF